jgi:hypothetical protein
MEIKYENGNEDEPSREVSRRCLVLGKGRRRRREKVPVPNGFTCLSLVVVLEPLHSSMCVSRFAFRIAFSGSNHLFFSCFGFFGISGCHGLDFPHCCKRTKRQSTSHTVRCCVSYEVLFFFGKKGDEQMFVWL